MKQLTMESLARHMLLPNICSFEKCRALSHKMENNGFSIRNREQLIAESKVIFHSIVPANHSPSFSQDSSKQTSNLKNTIVFMLIITLI